LNTLFEIRRRLSGRLQRKSKLVTNEVGVLLGTAEEEMHRWREHFEGVLNLASEVEPSGKLNIRTRF